MKKETVADLFKLAITAEKIMQDYYEGLANKFSNLSKVSNFWQDMANDESHHGAALESMCKSLSDTVLFSEAEFAILQKCRAYLKRVSVKDMLSSVKTLDDAYELAHELESSEANIVFKFLTAKFIKPEKRMKITIAMIENHINKIMDFSEKFGNAKWRKTIIIMNK